jgi:hypothetical protein
MKKRLLFLLLFFIFIVGCTTVEEPTGDIENQEDIGLIGTNVKEVNDKEIIEEETVIKVEKTILPVTGPGGCIGLECDTYFQNNPEESQKWCDENPSACEVLIGGDSGSGPEGPGGCLDDCEEYCETNPDECELWCSQNLDKNLELCGFMIMEDGALARQGDGVWDKNELTFYIKDEEGVLSDKKRDIITGTIISTKEGSDGYYGWNKALEELNKLYPDNIVPDKIIEVNSESEADIVIAVHSLKEFCCDLTGDPITGKERSTIDDNSGKIKSNVDAYNIIKIDEGFLEDMMRHELGHTMGIFSHVTSRNNDLMSIVSPASVIKKGNLDDLYVKYKNRIIETVQESREADESVFDQKVRSP